MVLDRGVCVWVVVLRSSCDGTFRRVSVIMTLRGWFSRSRVKSPSDGHE